MSQEDTYRFLISEDGGEHVRQAGAYGRRPETLEHVQRVLEANPGSSVEETDLGWAVSAVPGGPSAGRVWRWEREN